MKLEFFGLTIAAKFDKEDLQAASIDRAARREIEKENRAAAIETRRETMRKEEQARKDMIAQRIQDIKDGKTTDEIHDMPTTATELREFAAWKAAKDAKDATPANAA